MMYNIYVTNKAGEAIAYVRLSSEKMQYADIYVQKIKEGILEGKLWAKEYIFFLALGGFCKILTGNTHAFSVENAGASLYISVVYARLNTVEIANFPFDPKMYGCLTILIGNGNIVAISPYNPKAVWLPAKMGDKVPSDTIEAGFGRNMDECLYFGRIASLNGGMPCAVTSNGNLCREWVVDEQQKVSRVHVSGDLLKDTGFELIRANQGDAVPPNAVMTGVTEAEGSLFVGRVGGNIPCHITTKDGKIQHFVYGLLGGMKRVENGEVMVLTGIKYQ